MIGKSINKGGCGEMKKISLIKRVVPFYLLFAAFFLTACGSDKPKELLVGTWVSGNDEMVAFDESGSCTVPFTYDPEWWESAERYTVKEDGTLVLSSRTGHADDSFEQADSEEKAKEDDNTYFVSADMLIIDGETYIKSE